MTAAALVAGCAAIVLALAVGLLVLRVDDWLNPDREV